MHLLAGEADTGTFLVDEVRRAFPAAAVDALPGNLYSVDGIPGSDVPLPPLVFARQLLPDAVAVTAASIRGFADLLFERLVSALPDAAPWRLHVYPRYGQGTAGQHRCELIRDSLAERLQRHRRSLRRGLSDEAGAFSEADSLAQLVLTDANRGFLSIAPAPIPRRQRSMMLPFPAGEIPVASDKAAPSRAFAKLLEAELRLGTAVGAGETCVDLGASPGSWSYVALQRGARVTAVDRASLRDDLMGNPALTFHRGDAFRFQPSEPVDWLLCDVIAAPSRSIELVLDWVRRRLCRRFIVTIKFKGTSEYALLDQLKSALPTLCESLVLARLCANKNEACAAGIVVPRNPQGSQRLARGA